MAEVPGMDGKAGCEEPAESHPVERLYFFDAVRNIAMLAVILYHAVAAYSTATPHWDVHDGASVVADGVRHLFDVFMMPVFFFVAGHFALPALERKGPWGFLKGKGRRIGVPWFMAVLIVVPTVRYAGAMSPKGATFVPFGRYWLEYCGSVGQFRFGRPSAEIMGQMHFWFLSLLLAFFILLAAVRLLPGGRKALGAVPGAGHTASAASVYATLAWTSGLAVFAYFLLVSVIPEASWVSIGLLLQFQPASLVLYTACFGLGVLAARGRWFACGSFPGRPVAWGALSLVLSALFLVVGRAVFADSLATDEPSAAVLLAFSALRTALCLSILLLITAYARRRWDRSYAFNGKVAASSYGIYLCHLFVVIFLQHLLMVWKGGAPSAKAAIVFLGALPVSYGVARVMDRFPKSFAGGLCGMFALMMVLCR